MTVPLLFAPLEPTPASALFSPCSAEKSPRSAEKAGRSIPSRRTKQASAPLPSRTPQLNEAFTLDLIRGSLLESLSQGVIVTSRSLNPLYWNTRARMLCQHLSGSEFPPLELPAAVSEVCHRLMRDERSIERPIVMECQAPTGQTIRISVRWLELTTDQENVLSKTNARNASQPSDRSLQRQQYLLILLENCNDLLQEELRIERKKYDLTEREAEVWMLLRQEYTYQEIARMLQISLNTVKTHVKNVYAKKRSCQGREKFWCGD